MGQADPRDRPALHLQAPDLDNKCAQGVEKLKEGARVSCQSPRGKAAGA